MNSTAPKGTERYAVVVSRRWDEPPIRVSVDDFGIMATMTLFDFLTSVFKESGTPEEMQKAIIAATDRVVDEMKNTTGQVM